MEIEMKFDNFTLDNLQCDAQGLCLWEEELKKRMDKVLISNA